VWLQCRRCALWAVSAVALGEGVSWGVSVNHHHPRLERTGCHRVLSLWGRGCPGGVSINPPGGVSIDPHDARLERAGWHRVLSLWGRG